MDELSRVLFGEADAMFMSKRKKLRYMALKFGVNIRRPVRDEQGNKVDPSVIKDEILQRVQDDKLKEQTDRVLETIKALDESTYYFVLVATLRLPEDRFVESLTKIAHDHEYKELALRLLNTSAICGAAPERPATERVNVLWDLSDVLDEDLLKIDTYEDDEIENIDPLKIRAFDPWGRIDEDYACLLNSEPLRISRKIGRPIEFSTCTPRHFAQSVANMYRGISSDIFQVNKETGCLFLEEYRMIDSNNSIQLTKTISRKHIELANRLKQEHGIIKHLHPVKRFARLLLSSLEKEGGNFQDLLFSYLAGVDDYMSMCLAIDQMHSAAEEMLKVIEFCREAVHKEEQYLTLEVLQSLHTQATTTDSLSPVAQAWTRMETDLLSDVAIVIDRSMLTGRVAMEDGLFYVEPIPKDLPLGKLWTMKGCISFSIPGKDIHNHPQVDERLLERIIEMITMARILNETKVENRYLNEVYEIESTQLYALNEANDARLSKLVRDEMEKCIDDWGRYAQMANNVIIKVYRTSNAQDAAKLLTEKLIDEAKKLFKFINDFFFDCRVLTMNRTEKQIVDAIRSLRLDKKLLSQVTISSQPSQMFGLELSLHIPEPMSLFVPKPVMDFYSNIRSMIGLILAAEYNLIEVTTHYRLFRFYRMTMGNILFVLRLYIHTRIAIVWAEFMKNFDKPMSVGELIEQHRKASKAVRNAIGMGAKNPTLLQGFISLMSDAAKQCADAMLEGDEETATRLFDEWRADLKVFTHSLAINEEATDLLNKLVPKDLQPSF
ncbi:hypothetical protein WR25_01888 [Diploscapter pachys]|uniref:Gamma-tubulin complex component n=1 Tax=Diploscapter pachys TaxID=2018661 RepID=A0A2A2LAB1_9BILA|nr:hypothetical protein WR25_01888 [Diploscapter pachys]